MRRARWLFLGVLLGATWCAGASASTPPTDPSDTVPDTVPVAVLPVAPAPSTTVAVAAPLVPIPAGCTAPPAAQAVFIGVADNVVPGIVRYRVEKVLAGNLGTYRSIDLADVHYGDESRFLSEGQEYIVGVGVDSESGTLFSTVREPAPLFGGDAVIGVNDSDVECPRVEDPIRTLALDGRPVDSGVLTPLKGQGGRLLRSVLLPLVVALGALVGLVLFKQLVFAVGRSIRELGAAPRPEVIRERHHEQPSGVQQPVS